MCSSLPAIVDHAKVTDSPGWCGVSKLCVIMRGGKVVQLHKVATLNSKDDVTIHVLESKRAVLPWWEMWLNGAPKVSRA